MSDNRMIATIGYENETLERVIEKLKRARIERVIDIRAIAASRRPGFSKTILAASLDERGISYVHLRALGTPKAGREAARSGRTAEMRAIYAQHLAEPEAQLALKETLELACQKPSALLCYEADAARCHRRIVAEHLHEERGLKVIDL